MGGVVAGVLLMLTLLLVGRLAPGEAILQLRASSASIRFLASTSAGAAATILALMLTMLSLSYDPDRRFRRVHYQRIRQVARYSTAALVLGVFVLLLLVIPLEESSPLPGGIFAGLYYLIVIASAALGGMIVAIMLMLYHAIVGLIDFFEPEADNWLVADDGDGGDGAGVPDGDEDESPSRPGTEARGGGDAPERTSTE